MENKTNEKLSCPAVDKLGQCKACAEFADKLIAESKTEYGTEYATEDKFIATSMVHCKGMKPFCRNKDKVEQAKGIIEKHQ
jgi:hypothetical protein